MDALPACEFGGIYCIRTVCIAASTELAGCDGLAENRFADPSRSCEPPSDAARCAAMVEGQLTAAVWALLPVVVDYGLVARFTLPPMLAGHRKCKARHETSMRRDVGGRFTPGHRRPLRTVSDDIARELATKIRMHHEP